MKRSLRDYLLTLAVAVAVFTVVALFLIPSALGSAYPPVALPLCLLSTSLGL